MPLRMLLSTLLGAAGVIAQAAPPSTAPPQDIDVDAQARAKDETAGKPPSTEKTKPAATPPQDIDVDAMARAKDVPTRTSADAASGTSGAAATSSPASVPTPAAEATATPAASDSATTQPPANASTTSEPASTAAVDSTAAPQPATATHETAAGKPPVSDDVKRLGATCDAHAVSLLEAAQHGDFATATRDFDAKMRTAMTPEKFQKTWAELGQFGALIARGQSTIEKSDEYFAVGVPLMFEKSDLYAQVTCGSDGRIAGFHVKPLAKSKTAAPAKP